MKKQAGRQHAAAVRPDDRWGNALGSDGGEPLGQGPGWEAVPAGAPVPDWGAQRAFGARLIEEEWPVIDLLAPRGNQSLTTPSGPAHREHGDRPSAAQIYGEVQRSAVFQQVRRRYRRFVVPLGLAFLLWYFGYVITAVAAPALMARPVFGAVNVAMLAGLAQFLTTFLLTWAYARHARLYRDPVALELRWTVFEWGRARHSASGDRVGSVATGRGSGR